MNERIKELAEQARRYYLTLPTGYNPEQVGMYQELMEKFAELIVRECIGCCEQVISDPVPESVDTWLNGGELS